MNKKYSTKQGGNAMDDKNNPMEDIKELLKKYNWKYEIVKDGIITIERADEKSALKIGNANPFDGNELSNTYFKGTVQFGKYDKDKGFTPSEQTKYPINTSQGYLTIQAKLS